MLGRPSIDRAGMPDPATLHGRRAELVFAYLAVEHQRTVSREELADALWPELLPDTWAAALRGVVTDVRRFLDDAGLDSGELLGTAQGGYRIRLPGDAVVDVQEARDAAATARSAMGAGDPRTAAEAAARAAAVAGLPFLPQHEGSWVDGVRSELAALHVSALEIEAHAHAQAGDLRAAAAAADRLVRAEPYSETAHQLRISVLGDAGDRSGALRAYEHCRAVLERELGVTPSPDTEAVLKRALERTASAPAPSAANEPASPLAGWEVMVVEDHAFQRRTAVALLQRLGVGGVAEAPDGITALEQLERGSVADVVVCDLDMPGMDGIEFIRNVGQRGLANAVLIVSALDRRVLDAVRTVSEGYGLQVLGALEKPLTARALAESLAAYRAPAPAGRVAGDGARGARLQPIIDLVSGTVAAVEALPGGEASAAFELAGAALAAVELPLGVVLRLAHAESGDGTLADRLVATAAEHGVDPRHVVLAVAERPTGAPLDVLARLRVKGFGLWLDDVGPAHIAADRLARLPLTGLRVAPDLAAGAAGDAARAGALEDVLAAAQRLGLPAVVNGTDSGATFELLVELGCRHAQGEFVAPAMPAAELARWASSWRGPAALLGGAD